MIGYSISLAVSVNKLTNDKIQTVRVIYFNLLSLNLCSILVSVQLSLRLVKQAITKLVKENVPMENS